MICSSTVMMGLRDVMGSWKIMATFSPACPAARLGVLRISCPSKKSRRR